MNSVPEPRGTNMAQRRFSLPEKTCLQHNHMVRQKVLGQQNWFGRRSSLHPATLPVHFNKINIYVYLPEIKDGSAPASSNVTFLVDP